MAYISQYQYYDNAGTLPEDENWGSYQYVSLYDIVNNFMLMYSGNHSLVNNEERYKILFHAKRAVQELNYDAFKEVKVLQLNVDDNLRFILPSDYVNWVRLSLYKNGVLRPLTENIQVNSSAAYSQNGDGKILFDGSGNIITKFSDLDTDRITGIAKSIYLNNLSSFNGAYGYNDGGDWYFDYNVGARFGLNTETANFNPTFVVDKKTGVINFSSDMAGESCVLEYISDGMENGDDSKVTVNKLFEDYLYAHIEYAILNSKLNVQEYVVRRAQKRKTALFRNAKIRISNIHPGRLLMNMRGQNKWLK
tara:strand:+ start:59 stop:979 length:921 start_codon:yes stop_codon:yes gene_type:complete